MQQILNMRLYSIILFISLASLFFNSCHTAPTESDDVNNFLNALKSNKGLLSVLSDPNSLSNSNALQSILSNPNAASFIGSVLSNPDAALANIEKSLKDPSNAQDIADALTNPSSIVEIINNPKEAINSKVSAGVAKMVKSNQANMIISGLTNLLEQLKTKETKDETSLKSSMIDYIIDAANNNPKVSKALESSISDIRQVYNKLDLEKYESILNETLGEMTNITNALSDVVQQLANMLNDPSLLNSTTPFIETLLDLYQKIKMMNTSDILNPEEQAILDKFMITLGQTKNFTEAFASVKDDVIIMAYNLYMSNPNIPSYFKSSAFLKITSDFGQTLWQTKNLTIALEVVLTDIVDFVITYFNQIVTSKIIPEIVTTILSDPNMPKILQSAQVEMIATEFLVNFYQNRNLFAAFDLIKNDTIYLAYNAFIADPNVPTILKNSRVQQIILEFASNYMQTMDFSSAFDSIKNETLNMLYNDIMNDPSVPAFFKSAQFQNIVMEFIASYSQTHNLTAAFEASKESILSALLPLLLADQSQLPPFLQTPEAQEVISKFLNAYMQSMNAMDAFDSIKLDLVQLFINTTMNDPSLPDALKNPYVQAILSDFLTTFVETMNLTAAIDSTKTDDLKLIYEMFMANPNVPVILKNPSVQAIIGKFVTDYMETRNLTYALTGLESEIYQYLYTSFMSNPNVPVLLKNAEVQAIIADFFNTFMHTMDVKAAFSAIESQLGSLLYRAFMNDPNINSIFQNQEIKNIASDLSKHYSSTHSIMQAIGLTIEDMSAELRQVATEEMKAFISGISPQLFDLIKNANDIKEIISIIRQYVVSSLSQLSGSSMAPSPTKVKGVAAKQSSLLESSILESFDQKDLEDTIKSYKDYIGQLVANEIMNGIRFLAEKFLPGLYIYIENDNDIITFTNDFFKWLNGRVVARLLSIGFTEPPTTSTTTTTVSTVTTTRLPVTTTTKSTTNGIDQNVIDIINQIENQNQRNLTNIFGPTNQPLQTLPIIIEWG